MATITTLTWHRVAGLQELDEGRVRTVVAGPKSVCLTHYDGRYGALSNRCPHQGGNLSEGILTCLVESAEPGDYRTSRHGEILRCPWHQWEYDIRTGKSWIDPRTVLVRNFPVTVESGARLVEGPYVAETFPVSIEDQYVVVEF